MSLILGKKPAATLPTPQASEAPRAPGSPSAGSASLPAPPPQATGNNASIPPLPARINRSKPVANIIIVGESGSGKTESLKDLPWESGEIAFIDIERKGFAWQHKIPDDCYFPCESFEDALAVMRHVEANPKFKIGCVDSFTGFNITSHEQCKVKYSGYDIYSSMNSAAVKMLNACKSYRVRWILTAIPELLTTESAGNTLGVVIKRAAVVGRELEGKVESYFAYAVFLRVIPVQGKRAEHRFVLVSDGRTQAKIPDGVTDKLEMNNNVNELIKLIEKAEKK